MSGTINTSKNVEKITPGHPGRAPGEGRIARRFARLRAENRKALVTFISAGDPDRDTGQRILDALPGWGADIVELGMPFSDPMADGPVIEQAGLRALKAGMTLSGTLAMARAFREKDAETPLVLMGYFNPIHNYGTARFAAEAVESGVDGVIVVDLPPEEDSELYEPARKAGLSLIRLVAPTTDDTRLETILQRADGFIYYVSVAGITGAGTARTADLAPRLAHIKARTDLPVVAGFGINTPEDAAAAAQAADGAVVGSALVRTIAAMEGTANPDALARQVQSLARALGRA